MGMRNLVAKRLLAVPPVMISITMLAFFLPRAIPYAPTPFDQFMDWYSRIHPDSVIHIQWTDPTVHIQYLQWLGLARQQDGRFSGILQGDLGNSMNAQYAESPETLPSHVP
jgi:ABC-type dipeptide/oligopeptide/nickel transport system permease component